MGRDCSRDGGRNGLSNSQRKAYNWASRTASPDARRSRIRAIDYLKRALRSAYQRKADDILVLDLRKLAPSLCDYFVLLTGVTKDHLRTLADQIKETLDEAGVVPLHMEGYDVGKWILMDYGDFVFHIMDEEARSYYGLEMLWGDAPQRAYPDDFTRTQKAG